MQEINLLQNKVKDRTLQFERSNRMVIVLFSLIVLLEFAGIGGLYLLTRSANAKTADIKVQNTQIQNAMNEDQKTLTTAQGVQAQLKNVQALLKNHIYWSEFLNQVSAITPTNVRFNGISSSADGKLHIDAVAASYQDIGRLLLSLDTSDKFQDVKLHSISPSSGTEFGYSFSIDLNVTPDIFNKPQQ